MERKNNIVLSMVIPTFTFNKDLEDMTERCILSYLDQVDELIVVEDAGMFSINLQKLADTYVYHKTNLGFTKNANLGWKITTGNFVAIVNSDTYLVEGNLRDLCIPGKVTSPLYKNQDWGGQEGGLSGSFFVVPREIFESRGILNEEMHTWRSDSEYNDRTQDIFERVPTVVVYHEIEATNRAVGRVTEEERERDNLAYDQWKEGILNGKNTTK